jgi:ABC-2 type transport system ATP-binding protein
VHTACALVHRPTLILLDEPTVGADPESRLRLLRLVRTLAADGATVLYTTHYLGEIEDLDARVVILAAGRVRTEGSVAELVARHTRRELVLRFDAEPPALRWPGARRVGTALHLPADGSADPAVELVRAMDLLGPDRARLAGIELGRASLEQAYLSVLGTAGIDVDGAAADPGGTGADPGGTGADPGGTDPGAAGGGAGSPTAGGAAPGADGAGPSGAAAALRSAGGAAR